MQFIPAPDIPVDFSPILIVGGVTLLLGVTAGVLWVITTRRMDRHEQARLRARNAHYEAAIGQAKSARQRRIVRSRQDEILQGWDSENLVPTEPKDYEAVLTAAIGATVLTAVSILITYSVAYGAGQDARAQEEHAVTDSYRDAVTSTYGLTDIDMGELDFPTRLDAAPEEYAVYGTTTLRDVEESPAGSTITETGVTLIWNGDRFGLYTTADDGTRTELPHQG